MDEKKAVNAVEADPLVSIVIPVYNGENYMREAIDSALAQTYPNIEILVVNDGSTDNTREIAFSYGNKIRYFEKENGGVSTALNLAIKEMRGEYFSWLSHDDVYYPDKVQSEINALRESGDMLQVVYSAAGNLTMPENKITSNNVRLLNSYGKYVLVGAFAPVFGFISGCTLLIPKQFFCDIGMFDESLRAVQDYKLWFQMFRGKKMIYVGRSLVKSRVHALQTTYTYSKINDEEEWLYKWMMESFTESDLGGSGLDMYQFYGAAFSHMHGMPSRVTACGYVAESLMMLPETLNANHLRRCFAGYLGEFGGKGVWLYCAGRRARKVIASLYLRDIKINGIADGNPGKHGVLFEGLVCGSPAEMPREALIVITKLYPEDAEDMLRNMGYRHVIAYDDLMRWIIETPIKKELLGSFLKGRCMAEE